LCQILRNLNVLIIVCTYQHISFNVANCFSLPTNLPLLFVISCDPIIPADHSIRSESPNDNNASYSRLVYGNEDEQESSVSEYSGEESNNNINLNGTTGSRGSHGKPKVFSFAGMCFMCNNCRLFL